MNTHFENTIPGKGLMEEGTRFKKGSVKDNKFNLRTMKRRSLLVGVLALMLGTFSCEPVVIEANFEDTEDMSIFNFLQENDSLYGRFLKILEAGGIAKTLSAYNPYNEGYTLFLPDSVAVEEFINDNPDYATFEELLADTAFAAAISR